MFLYCQQHAREWATPLTCLETAEQLLRNYAIDPNTRRARRQPRHLHPAVVQPGRRALLDAQLRQPAEQHDQPLRRGRRGDRRSRSRRTSGRRGFDPDTGRRTPTPTPRRATAWGVDLNRNNTFGTIFDGYIGASYSCTSEVFAGPGRGVRARDQERALGRGHVPEHQVLEQHPQLRRLLHVGAGRVPAGPRRRATLCTRTSASRSTSSRPETGS